MGNKDTFEGRETDNSYHCKYASRMNILSMDPSVAVVGVLFCRLVLSYYVQFDFSAFSVKLKQILMNFARISRIAL